MIRVQLFHALPSRHLQPSAGDVERIRHRLAAGSRDRSAAQHIDSVQVSFGLVACRKVLEERFLSSLLAAMRSQVSFARFVDRKIETGIRNHADHARNPAAVKREQSFLTINERTSRTRTNVSIDLDGGVPQAFVFHSCAFLNRQAPANHIQRIRRWSRK